MVLGTPAHAGHGSNDYISNRTEFRVMASGDDILRALARQQFAGRNSSPVDRFLTDALTEAGGKIAGGAQSVARALMTPGDAMRGAYNYAEVNPDGSVNPVPTAMIDDAANMAGVISLGAMPMVRPRGSLGMGGKVSDYGMEHRPPNPRDGYGAYLHDASGMYGDDIYSANALNYFGTGNPKMDRESLAAISHARNNPSAPVTIYRVIPSNIDASINPGDWVTTSKEYARLHGDSVLGGDYKVVKQTVPARQLTNAGDIHEWGWWPE